MTIQIPEHILLLVEAALKGQPTSADTETLRQWRMENGSHEAVYRQLKKIWEEAGVIIQGTTYNADNAWNKVNLRLASGCF
ncbi:hypothetical protein FAM09_29735 [Niastella caeni]|uniref:Uncharacterized protein n=1 Tax=Niastella caeni TaxID=2569763 RepID=A0A4S8HBJ6_9BACT|nr:hypothetical protein [Niastella caeni]THU30784.1 hypothetical protein FAM09_29735 [Niastella caeni]